MADAYTRWSSAHFSPSSQPPQLPNLDYVKNGPSQLDGEDVVQLTALLLLTPTVRQEVDNKEDGEEHFANLQEDVGQHLTMCSLWSP